MSLDSDEPFTIPTSECPKCKRMTLISMYGMAGGGMGSYQACDTEDCDYFDKQQDPQAMKPPRKARSYLRRGKKPPDGIPV